MGLPTIAPREAQPGDIVIVGASNCTPYEPGKPSHAADAPGALRTAVERFIPWATHHDFDTGGPLLPDRRLFDAGDIATHPDQPDVNRDAIRATVATLREADAIPIVIGGDDAVPIPVFEAMADGPPFWIVQVDAHIDWCEERHGERLGWSSTMRRASEHAAVQGIVQVGIRGVGSAGADEVHAAQTWGAHILTAQHIAANGIGAALDLVPAGARTFITIDCDALDPAMMPAVLAKAPGGLTYQNVSDLILGLGLRTQLIGMNVVELVPHLDIDKVSAKTAARFITHMFNAARR